MLGFPGGTTGRSLTTSERNARETFVRKLGHADRLLADGADIGVDPDQDCGDLHIGAVIARGLVRAHSLVLVAAVPCLRSVRVRQAALPVGMAAAKGTTTSSQVYCPALSSANRAIELTECFCPSTN